MKKSRFGKVWKSDVVGLNRMMATHREEAAEWILETVAGVDDDVTVVDEA